MSNLKALGHYINYCNYEGKTSERDNEGMRLILKLPEGTFSSCLSGNQVYEIVQANLDI